MLEFFTLSRMLQLNKLESLALANIFNVVKLWPVMLEALPLEWWTKVPYLVSSDLRYKH